LTAVDARELLHQLIDSMSDQEAARLLQLLVTERQNEDPLGQELVEALAQIRAQAERLQS
jgi:hypothetical protein